MLFSPSVICNWTDFIQLFIYSEFTPKCLNVSGKTYNNVTWSEFISIPNLKWILLPASTNFSFPFSYSLTLYPTFLFLFKVSSLFCLHILIRKLFLTFYLKTERNQKRKTSSFYSRSNNVPSSECLCSDFAHTKNEEMSLLLSQVFPLWSGCCTPSLTQGF